MPVRFWPPLPGLALFGFSLSLCLLVAPYHLSSPDSELYFRTTQSLAQLKGLAIEPLATEAVPVVDETGRVVPVTIETFGTSKGLDGREYSQYGIGLPLAGVPFYWIAELTEPLVPFPANVWRRVCVSTVNALVTALLAWVVYRWASFATGETRAGLIAGLLFTTATYGFEQSKYLYSEPLAGLCLLAGAWLLDADRKASRTGRLLLAGALIGSAILTRLDSLVAGLGFVALLWLPNRGETLDLKAQAQRTLITAGPVLLALCIIGGLNYLHFGSAFSTGYGDQAEGFNFNTPLLVGLQGLLLSTGRGLLIYSPLFILTPIALVRLAKMRRTTAWAIFLVSLGFIITMAKWQNWEGGWCWGPRHICQIAAFWSVPLAVFFTRGVKWGGAKLALLAALVVVSVFVQFLGLSQDAVEVYRSLNPAVHPHTLFNAVYSPMRFHWHYLLEGRHDFGLPVLLKEAPLQGLAWLIVVGAAWAGSSLGLSRYLRGEKS